jgi:hypothetical protein
MHVTQGELSDSALDLLLTDIIVWPVRVVYRALTNTSSSGAPVAVGNTRDTWEGTSAGIGR